MHEGLKNYRIFRNDPTNKSGYEDDDYRIVDQHNKILKSKSGEQLRFDTEKEAEEYALEEDMNKEWTATDIVKDLYDKFPQVSFYDETDLDNDMVGLKFYDADKVDQDQLEELIKSYNVWYRLRGNKLLIKAKEDEEYVTESINLYNINRWVDSTSKPYYEYGDAITTLNNAGNPIQLSDFHPTPEMTYRVKMAMEAGRKLNPGSMESFNELKEICLPMTAAASALNYSDLQDSIWRKNYSHRSSYFDNLITIAAKYGDVNRQKILDELKPYEEKKIARKRSPKQTSSNINSQSQQSNITPGTFHKVGYNSFSNQLENALEEFAKVSGHDIVYQVGNVDNRNIRDLTIYYDRNTPNEYKQEIKAKQVNPQSDIIVLSGDGFKNLPVRQFIAWTNRKLNQLAQEKANAVNDQQESLKEDLEYGEDSKEAFNEFLNKVGSTITSNKQQDILEKNNLIDWSIDDYDVNDSSITFYIYSSSLDKVYALEIEYDYDPDQFDYEIEHDDIKGNDYLSYVEYGDKETFNNALENTFSDIIYSIKNNQLQLIEEGCHSDEKKENININESLNQIDINTYNKYDLLNMYKASGMNNDQKNKLANMISLNESYDKISSYLQKFI